MEKDYAILFKKKIISGKYDVICYQPCYAIAGIYDDANMIFLDELNNERILITDVDNLSLEEEYYVGDICSESELMERYPSSHNIDEALIFYNADAQDSMYIGVLNQVSNTINIVKFNLEEFTNKFGVNISKLNNDIKNIEDKKEPPVELTELDEKNYYSYFKDKLNNQDFTMFLTEDLEKLSKMTDANEYKHYVLTLKREKENYFHRSGGDNKKIIDQILIVDSDINILLQLESLDEMKDYMNSILNSIDDQQSKSNELYKYYTVMNNYIQSCKTIEEVKEFLKQMQDEFTKAYNEMKDNYNEEEVSSYLRLLSLQITAGKILLTFNKLEDIKQKYQEVYDSSLELLVDSAKELFGEEEIKEENISTEIEESEKETKKMTEEDYEDLFKQKTSKELKESISEEVSKLDDLVGLENVKEMISRITARMIFNNKTENILNIDKPNMNMVFTGNPGTGKTTVASIVAPIFHKLGYLTSDKVTVVAAEDLIAGYVGQTAIKTKKVIDENKGGLIILDEAYILSGSAQQFGPEALTVILKEMETNRTAFVFAGYEKEMGDFIKMNSGLKSRIKPRNFVEFKDYSTDELLEIFVKLFDKVSIDKTKKLTFGEGVLDKVRSMIDEAKKNVDFGNARYVNSLFQEVIDEHALNVEDATSIEELLTISLKDIPERKVKVKEPIGFH